MTLEARDWLKLLLCQDGETTPVSDLTGRENHIFAVVPKAEVEAGLDRPACASHADRRLPVFDAAVPGGAALLLLELWRSGGVSGTSCL